MWPKEYKDYPIDKPLIKSRVEPGKGIIGCEMHEINGWGENIHFHRKKKESSLLIFLKYLFKQK